MGAHRLPSALSHPEGSTAVAPSTRSRTWVLIVNYRTAELVVDSLRALAPQRDALAGCVVKILDNASQDGSVDSLRAAIAREGWSDWAELIPLEENRGFAAGNNAGIRLAMAAADPADYLLLLNPDTVMRPGAIAELVAFMDAHPTVGIAGAALETPSGELDRSAHRAPSALSELESSAQLALVTRLLRRHAVSPPRSDAAHSCDWVSGACMMIRREAIEDTGLMDEGFFLYFEEVDYCCRARAAGWAVWYVPESRVLHLEGASTGIRSVARRRPGYWFDSRRRYFVKHHGIRGWIWADLLWTVGRTTYLLRRTLRLSRRSITADPKWLTLDLLGRDFVALLSLLTGKSHAPHH